MSPDPGLSGTGRTRAPSYYFKLPRIAEKRFGPVGKQVPYRQAFHYVVSAKDVRLNGESEEYAETELNWVPATAHLVPEETAPEGEGYFSIIEGKNGKLYIGTHANGLNAWLVEFDPRTRKMTVVVDAMKEIGSHVRGFTAQARIHTRNNAGASGKIYFGTKQGYPGKGEKREDCPGGYPKVYDPATGKTKVYPIPVPHQGINSITSTC